MRKNLLIIIAVLLISCHKTYLEPTNPDGDAGTIIPTSDALLGDSNIVDGYLKRFAITDDINDSIELYLNAKRVVKNARLKIYDVTGTYKLSIYTDSIIPQYPSGSKAYEDGFNYKQKIAVQLKLPVGYYTIGKKIPFIVKSTVKQGDVVILYPTNTINAYNTAGGSNLYATPKATVVSFMRPIPSADQFTKGFLKSNPLPNAHYIIDKDMDDYSNIQNYKVLVIIGHSEYWTRAARTNYSRFIKEGKRVLILSGNTMWWQVRYEGDKMICYKLEKDPITSTKPLLATTYWNDPKLNFNVLKSIGGEFTYAGYGQKVDSGWNGYKIIKPTSPLFAGMNLQKGQVLSCPASEWDGVPVVWVNGDPKLNRKMWAPYKEEVVAYDRVTRSQTVNTNSVGTLIVFKNLEGYGTVINMSNTNWCAGNGIGAEGTNAAQLRQITINAVNGLVEDKNMFSY